MTCTSTKGSEYYCVPCRSHLSAGFIHTVRDPNGGTTPTRPTCVSGHRQCPRALLRPGEVAPYPFQSLEGTRDTNPRVVGTRES